MAGAPGIGLIFHGIGAPHRVLEPGEAPYWLTEAQFLAILDRIAADPDPGRFRISFDDGNVSDHDIALPALRARGLRADFFVLTGRLDQPGSLSRAQVLALQAQGMMIGSHGIGHRRLPDLSDALLAQELSQSRAALEDLCGRPVTGIGIPFGAYDRRVLSAIRRAGYLAAWSSDRGPMRPGDFPGPRTSFTGAMDQAAVTAILAGGMPLGQRLRRALGRMRRRWL